MDGLEDGFAQSLDRLLSDAAAETAGRDRSRARLLRRIAEEEATFLGLAVELAERGDEVVARTTAGRAHRGCVMAVGRDFVVLRAASLPPLFLAAGRMTLLRPLPGGGLTDSVGAREAPLDVTLAAVLSRVAADRPRLQVMATGDAQPLTGELRAVGRDVATLRLDGEGHLVYLRIASLAEVVLLEPV